ncbi:hypothetical protein [Paraburkholderia sp. BL21I4N1]|uniref:hypothetical protein n=1 Tax=Paraburkholderia sp. BL21I4N1 TaxID=1938801 RepID=UPI000D475ECD|nr:hypothetical protein [Paraburkholderia sp. BL21I4N1]PQV49165.1 hypothetical protein B0G83_107110 [Paraburkholderia sp. BL21I4N1]
MTNRTTVACAMLMAGLLGAQLGHTQDRVDSLTVSAFGLARPFESPVPLDGNVRAFCANGNAQIGGFSGQVTDSTTKGLPTSGYCSGDYVVRGSVKQPGNLPVECAAVTVARPQSGWNGNTHYAHFGSVVVSDNKVVCSMGGE